MPQPTRNFMDRVEQIERHLEGLQMQMQGLQDRMGRLEVLMTRVDERLKTFETAIAWGCVVIIVASVILTIIFSG